MKRINSFHLFVSHFAIAIIATITPMANPTNMANPISLATPDSDEIRIFAIAKRTANAMIPPNVASITFSAIISPPF